MNYPLTLDTGVDFQFAAIDECVLPHQLGHRARFLTYLARPDCRWIGTSESC